MVPLVVFGLVAGEVSAATVIAYARQHANNPNITNPVGILGAPDGSLAEGVCTEQFYAFDFDLASYSGIIQRVKIGVLAENDDGDNTFVPFAMRVTYGLGTSPPAPGNSEMTFNHKDGLEWAELDITRDEITWRWADLSRIRVYIQFGSGVELDTRVRYDAVKVEVTFRPPSPTPLPTATMTPTPTVTPTPTPIQPTATPTATPVPNSTPHVLAAGYLGNHATTSQGGDVTLTAWVEDSGQSPIVDVEVYVMGVPSGVVLPPLSGSPGLYQLRANLGPTLFPDFYLFELRARNATDGESRLWPYLQIDGPTTRSWQGHYRETLSGGPRAGVPGLRPRVLYAGWMETELSIADGGVLHLIAGIGDPQGSADIARVELLYREAPTGIQLLDDGQSGDFAPGDGVFGLQVPIAPGSLDPGFAGRQLFQIEAIDWQGGASLRWPYYHVE